MRSNLPIPKARPVMPAVKPPREGPFYVIFDKYKDYNQFEGEWETSFVKFSSKLEADKDIRRMKGHADYRNIIGPLTKV